MWPKVGRNKAENDFRFLVNLAWQISRSAHVTITKGGIMHVEEMALSAEMSGESYPTA